MLQSPEFDMVPMIDMFHQPQITDMPEEIRSLIIGNNDVIAQVAPSLSLDIELDCSKGKRKQEQEKKQKENGNRSSQLERVSHDISRLERIVNSGTATQSQIQELSQLKGQWRQLRNGGSTSDSKNKK